MPIMSRWVEKSEAPYNAYNASITTKFCCFAASPGMPIMSRSTPMRWQTAAKSTESEIGMPVRLESTWSSSELRGE